MWSNMTAHGTVYRIVYIFITKEDCTTLTAGLDNGAEGQARYDGLMRYYRHGRDNQWMGASLDVSEDRAIVVRNHAAFTHVIFLCLISLTIKHNYKFLYFTTTDKTIKTISSL